MRIAARRRKCRGSYGDSVFALTGAWAASRRWHTGDGILIPSGGGVRSIENGEGAN
jgi:hypothetical protein